MKPLRYVSNVVRGEYAHWNDTNNRIISALWKRAEKLDRVQTILLQAFIVSSSQIMDHLLNPDEETLLQVKQKKLEMRQFEQLYDVLLSTISKIYEALNPSLSPAIREGFRAVTTYDLEGPPLSLPIGDDGKQTLTPIAYEIWDKVVRISGSKQGISAIDGYPFTILYMSAVGEAFKNIKAKLHELYA